MKKLEKMTKILVSGTRKANSKNAPEITTELENYIFQNWKLESELVLLHGGAKGTDTIVENWAQKKEWTTEVITPNYQKYHAQQAPLKRNSELVAKADIVICYYAKGEWRKGGTWDTARKTLLAGKQLLEIEMDGGNVLFTPKRLSLFA